MLRGTIRRCAIAAVAILAVAAGSGVTQAAQIAPGIDHLQDLLATGSTGVVVGDKRFYDFTYTGTGVNVPTAAQIAVSTPGGPDIGIRFSFSWTANAGEVLDTLIGYKVSVIPANMWIDKVGLTFDGSVSGVAIASVTESVQDLNGDSIGPDSQLAVVANPTQTVLTDLLDLIPDRKDLQLRKDIQVASLGGTATITFVDNTFPQVPEPSLLGLAAAALPMLMIRRQRRT